jgi:hypothetical protein
MKSTVPVLFLILFHICLSGSAASAADYYLDSVKGNDANSGHSRHAAWRTLDNLNRTVFKSGDKILFAAASQYTGQFAPKGSGNGIAPIIIDLFGGTRKALIDGRGQVEAPLLLRNVEYWMVRNLELTNEDPAAGKRRYGVLIQAENCGTLHDIHLKELFIHDIRGSLKKSDRDEGFGILWENWGDKTQSRFDGLLIENCRLLRCDRSGIGGWSGHQDRRQGQWFPSLKVVIRKNLLEDIGGDCIKPEGCDGALVEHNRVDRGRQRCTDAAAGIWPWASDSTVIQYNEVSGIKGTFDGQAFDSDDNCRNTLFQFNYSHDNDGGFMLICSVGKQLKDGQVTYLGLENTTIRYNISQNDGSGGMPPFERRPRIIHIAGSARNTWIYNNVFFTRKGLSTYFIHNTEYEGWAEEVHLLNNIIIAAGELKYDLGSNTRFDFRKNAFFGNHVKPPEDTQAISTDPLLEAAGSGGIGLNTLNGYRLLAGSPCIGTAVPIPGNGGKDFWGSPVKPDGPSSVGAQELPAAARRR